MGYNLSACVFIRDCFRGAFCLFESMCSVMHLVDEFVILDLGSTDGTYEILQEIEESNPKVILAQSEFPEVDAGAFATLANDLVRICGHDKVWFYQADEVPHQDLLVRIEETFQQGNFDLAFWRIQLGQNFQNVRWYPHLVHRVGLKGKFHFTGDGMSTDRTFDARICSDYDGGWFPKWGGLGPEKIKPYLNQMVLDVSLLGGFLENIPGRRALHAPFWHEEPDIEGLPANQWIAKERQNQEWYRTESPYNIPKIMEYHVGKVRYELRQDLLEALKRDETRDLVF